MKILLFLGLWLMAGSFLGALALFLVLGFISFITRAFFGAAHELGLFTTILLFFSFLWLFGGDE